jgi:hypothetical protein
MVVYVPAFCPRCSEWFTTRDIAVGVGAAVSLWGNTTICPTCKGKARFLDADVGGVSDPVYGEILTVANAAPWTIEKLAEYLDVLLWAAEFLETEPEAVVERMEEVHPPTASILEKELAEAKSAKRKKFLVGVICSVAAVVATSMTQSVTDRLIENIWPDPARPHVTQPDPASAPVEPTAPNLPGTPPPSSPAEQSPPPHAEETDPPHEPPATESPK